MSASATVERWNRFGALPGRIDALSRGTFLHRRYYHHRRLCNIRLDLMPNTNNYLMGIFRVVLTTSKTQKPPSSSSATSTSTSRDETTTTTTTANNHHPINNTTGTKKNEKVQRNWYDGKGTITEKAMAALDKSHMGVARVIEQLPITIRQRASKEEIQQLKQEHYERALRDARMAYLPTEQEIQ